MEPIPRSAWSAGRFATGRRGPAARTSWCPPGTSRTVWCDRRKHPSALHPLGRGAAPSPSDMLLRRAASSRRVGGFEEHFTGASSDVRGPGLPGEALPDAGRCCFADSVWLDYRQHPASIVATVKRDGQRDEVRRYFFTWFEATWPGLPERPPRAVRRAVARKLRPYRRPVAHAALTFLERLARKARRTARRSVLRLGGRRTT